MLDLFFALSHLAKKKREISPLRARAPLDNGAQRRNDEPHTRAAVVMIEGRCAVGGWDWKWGVRARIRASANVSSSDAEGMADRCAKECPMVIMMNFP